MDASKRPMEFMLALDTSTRVAEQLGENIEYPFTTMITHPSMCREVLEKWIWKRHYFRMYEPDSAFLETLYSTLFPFIHSRVMNSGSVVNNLIIIANGLGFNPIYLVGVDYGYPTIRDVLKPSELLERLMPRQLPNESDEAYRIRKDGDAEWQKFMTEYKKNPNTVYRLLNLRDQDVSRSVRRFRDYDEIGYGVYEPKEWDLTDVEHDPTLITADCGVHTTPVNLFYKHTLLTNWKLMGNQLINCSYGLLKDTGMPFMDILDVVRQQGEGVATKPGDPLWMDREKINELVDKYMIPRGSYAKYGPSGEILGVEFVHGLMRQREEAQAKAKALDHVIEKWKYDGERWDRRIDPEDTPWQIQKPELVKP